MYVATYLTAGPDGSRATWSSAVDEQGYQTSQEITEIGTTSAPAEVAERLRLAAGTPTVVRRRILRVDGVPVQLSDSYYPAGLAEGTELARPGKLRGYSMGALERLGIELDRFQDDIYLRMPTPAEAAKLQLGRGVPVVKLLRTTYSTENMPVEVADQVLAGDRYVLSYEVPAHASIERSRRDAE
jgi:GntR family transcriptional regulator